MMISTMPYPVGVHTLACWPLGKSTLRRELQRGFASYLPPANGSAVRDKRYCDSPKSLPKQPCFRQTPTAFNNKAQGRGTHPGYAVFRNSTPTGLYNTRDLWNPVGVQLCNNVKPSVRVATLGFVVEPRCGSYPPIGNHTNPTLKFHYIEASIHAVTCVAPEGLGSRIGDNADLLRQDKGSYSNYENPLQ